MQRYLIYYSYLGTKFRGLQKQNKRVSPSLLTSSYLDSDEGTVQGALESAIWRSLTPLNQVKLYCSSRTDAGVHALCNTAHVDLEKQTEKADNDTIIQTYYNPKLITLKLNTYFRSRNLDIS